MHHVPHPEPLFAPRSVRRVPARAHAAKPGLRAWVLLAVTTVITACSAAAKPSAAPTAPPPAASPPVPLDPEIVTGVLDNGLAYYLRRHESEEKRAHLLLVVKAGSLYEEDDQRGLAHLVEHMAFNGTRRFEKQTLVDFFEKSGLTFGSHANATTGYDRTMYQVSVPTDDPKVIATWLNVLEDWADGITFAPDDVLEERPVLISEWNSAQGAARRVGEQQRKLLLAGSKYVEREVIGDKAVLEKAPIERMVDFYRRWYRPDRMGLIVVGDIEPPELQKSIQAQFSRLKAPAGPADNPTFDIPISPQPKAAVITDPETPAASAGVIYKSRARLVRNEVDYRARLVSEMGVLMLRRRLHEAVQNPRAPFTSAGSQLSSGVFGQLDLIQVSARAKENQVQTSLEGLLSELERVKRHGFLQAELERTKVDYARFLEHAVAAKATAEGVNLARSIADHFVTGDALPSPEYLRDLGNRLLPEVTAAEVSQAALSWMTDSERLIMVTGATRDKMPEEAALLAALSEVEKRSVNVYVDRAAEGELLSPLPEPGTIVKEESIAEIGVKVWTLSNGARVVLKATEFKDDEILGRAISRGGTSRASDSEFPSARFANDVVITGGLGKLPRHMVNKLLTGKVVSANPWIGEHDEGLSGSAAPKDVESMFQLMHLYATAPRRDEEAFETFRAALREGLRNRDLNPIQVFGDAISKSVWGGSPRRMPPTVSSVEEINLDAALAFYKQRFADLSDVSFVFVGEVDEAGFRPLVERYLASLPGGGRKDPYRDLGLHRKRGITKVRVQQGKDDKAVVTIIFHGETAWSENAHTDLNSLENYLRIRMREVLREELGGVYTPYVGYSFERVPFDSYNLVVSFDCKPGDVEKLRAAMQGVIADVKKSGVGESYLEKLRSQRTRELEESYRTNGFWLSRLVDNYNMNEDPRQILMLHELTKRVTSDNIRLAAQKFLQGDQYVDALLTPAPAEAAKETAKPAATTRGF